MLALLERYIVVGEKREVVGQMRWSVCFCYLCLPFCLVHIWSVAFLGGFGLRPAGLVSGSARLFLGSDFRLEYLVVFARVGNTELCWGCSTNIPLPSRT